MSRSTLFAFFCLSIFTVSSAFAHGDRAPGMHWAAIRAKDKTVRSAIVNNGFSIENIVQDMSYGYATPETIESLEKQGFEVVSHFAVKEETALDFPDKDSLFHNYAEQKEEMQAIARDFPRVAHMLSMGKSLEGREMLGLRLNPNVATAEEPSGLPGAILMGGHHAREHVSIEVPLKLARFLASGYQTDATIRNLLDHRDVFIFPSINPDGSEFDISTGSYKSYRKNRRINAGSTCMGVDLNRNYDFHWGQGGSSKDACSDIFMGPSPFSEPETQNVRNFVLAHPNLKVLLSYHTFSELVLYPWGYTYDGISNPADFATFKTMGDTMAGWNHYTSEASSDLYITTGDTVDWAYGTLGMFAFTFELSPRDMWSSGGFYPGQAAIEPTFQANIKPAMYLIDLADDPHRANLHPETTLFYGQQ